MAAMNKAILMILFVLLALFSGGSQLCAGGDEPMSNVTVEAAQEVLKKTIYFGHQSVGNNILSGIKLIAPEFKDYLVDIADVADIDSVPNFYHSRVGANVNPQSRIEDFKRILETRFNDAADLAFLKFCYVDVK
jgi:hypothetical protein